MLAVCADRSTSDRLQPEGVEVAEEPPKSTVPVPGVVVGYSSKIPL